MLFTSGPEGVPAGTVTWTEIVQVPGVVILPAGIVPPARLTLVGVVETVPGGTPQVLLAAPLTINGAGKLSVTAAPVYGEPVGFCNVMIRVLVPPTGKVEGKNRLVRPIASTFSRAVAGLAFVRF